MEGRTAGLFTFDGDLACFADVILRIFNVVIVDRAAAAAWTGR
ncbi:hypothetical protein IBTHAUMO2_240086 [Nitrosopumilaceae archaeon]|nr:hypothetical protein IBTHAUMO2_240086 [Nitrosopumilaceae archaeon]